MVRDRYLTDREVFKITGRAVQTLRNDRFCGRGIPYVKIGRMVRYSEQAVYDYMDRHKVDTAE